MYKIKLSDLRYLSYSGNATVKLDHRYHYQIGEIRRDGIYTSQVGFVQGKMAEIKVRESFVKIFPHIQTVKQGRVLIAERRKGELIGTSSFEKRILAERSRVNKVKSVNKLHSKSKLDNIKKAKKEKAKWERK